jgi:hypothetical protein
LDILVKSVIKDKVVIKEKPKKEQAPAIPPKVTAVVNSNVTLFQQGKQLQELSTFSSTLQKDVLELIELLRKEIDATEYSPALEKCRQIEAYIEEFKPSVRRITNPGYFLLHRFRL